MKTLNAPKITSAMLQWHVDNSNRNTFVSTLAKRLIWKCKSIPAIYGTRTAVLIGLVYDQFDGDEYLLDIAVEAIQKANATINRLNVEH